MQEYFFQEFERRINLNRVVININKLIDRFDDCAFPVFHVVSRYKADGSNWDLKMKSARKPELIEGTRETEILPEINVLKSHAIVTKTRYSAFFKTTLDESLRDENVVRAVVVGAYTHYCVNATIFDAYCYDYIPCIITDAVISHLTDEADVMIDRMRRNGYHVLSTDEFLSDLKGIKIGNA